MARFTPWTIFNRYCISPHVPNTSSHIRTHICPLTPQPYLSTHAYYPLLLTPKPYLSTHAYYPLLLTPQPFLSTHAYYPLLLTPKPFLSTHAYYPLLLTPKPYLPTHTPAIPAHPHTAVLIDTYTGDWVGG